MGDKGMDRVWKSTLRRFSASRALTEILQGAQQARLGGTSPCLDSGLMELLQNRTINVSE